MSPRKRSNCLETISETSSLNRHEQYCLKNPDFDKDNKISKYRSIECSICLQQFTSYGYFQHSKLHVERMNLDEVINCPLCGYSLENRTLLNAHIHESHDAPTGCCGICFKIVSKEILYGHLKKSHNYEYRI
uniref:PR domain containing 14 [Homo sapiens] n=1 Tax=Lepeophtheirus salmonis TaxID=72036 RepID=A0A0K2VF46_LEPSM